MKGSDLFDGHRLGFTTCIIYLLIVLLLFSFSLLAQGIYKPINLQTPDTILSEPGTWDDGSFSGIWTNDETAGSFSGVLSHKRSSFQGSFHGMIISDTGQTIGTMNGFFNKHSIFGSISNDVQNIEWFFGSLEYDETSFTATIRFPRGDSFSCNGVYESSFLPPLNGEFSVGVKTLHLIDSSREEWFSDDQTDVRELMVRVWYPSIEIDPLSRIDYMDETTFKWLKDQSPIPLISIPITAYSYIRPHGYEQAVVYRDAAPFPVLIFSHGYDGVDAIYSSFIEDMVSHGYIVVSINHPYVAGITVFPDGKVIKIAPVPSGNVSEFFTRSLRTVIDDVLFVLDEMMILNDFDEQLSGCFDFSKVGMYGHSFGGAATVVCCFEDERFKAGLTLDGVVYDELITGDIPKPLLLLLAEGRINNQDTLDLFDKISTDAYMVGILGSTHYGYTDVGVLLSHLLPTVPQRLLGFGTIDAKRMVDITRVIGLAFFDVYLKEMDKQVLFDVFSLYDEVVVQSK